MSSNPVPVPNLPPKAEILCVSEGCGEVFIVDIPRPRIANHLDVTTIAFVHQRIDRCPKCHGVYVFQVTHFELDTRLGFRFVLVQQPSVIAPGTQTNLAQAINVSDVATKIKLQ